MTASRHMVETSPTDSAFPAYVSQKSKNLTPSVDHRSLFESDRRGTGRYPQPLNKVKHGEAPHNTPRTNSRSSGGRASRPGPSGERGEV